MKLIIVESPTKAKTISRFLDKNYHIDSSFGHVRDLPQTSLGVNVDNHFEPHYVIPKKARPHIKRLGEEAKRASEIYFATDEDREGEAISWHIAEILKEKYTITAPTHRITFHEITPHAVLSALQNPRTIDTFLVDAQQARRILDRLVGYKLSPFLWKKVVKRLSAGRVQSVAVRLIIERENEITAFKTQEFWTIHGLFAVAKDSSHEITADLYEREGKKIEKFDIQSKKDADEYTQFLNPLSYRISHIEEKRIHKKPYPPYKTSTLQQDAYTKLRFSSKQTMAIAQQLYEGVELGEKGSVGLITYMRTDSLSLSNKFIVQAQEYLKNKFGNAYSFTQPRRFKNTTKNAQEAHEAIRPTDLTIEPDTIKPHLTSNQYKLYRLIFERALASLMPDAEIIQKIIEMSGFDNNQGNPSAIFKTIGNTIHFDGFLKIYPLSIKEQSIPPLTLEEKATLTKLQPQQHFTEPPPRYNDASLVKELERRGIGRPSTYAPIIETILKRNYITRDENKRFIPTEIGTVVNQVLVEHFPHIVDYDFTAHMENELDDIAHKHKPWVDVVQEFFVPFEKNLEKKYKEVSKKELTEEKTDIQCPLCKKHNLIIKLGRYGRFLACPGFPDCTHTQPLETQQTSTQNGQKEEIDAPLCDTCNEKMIIKEGRFGKFFACKNYPKCKNTKAIEKKINMKCPLCTEGDVVVKRTKRGKTFYGCNTYPDCTFASWKKPETENSEQGITSSE